MLFHRAKNKFHAYSLLNDYTTSIPLIYHIDHDKQAILMENIDAYYMNVDTYNEKNTDGEVVRANYNVIMRAMADWHGSLWDNYKAFDNFTIPWHFENKDNLLWWINDAMTKPFAKYKKAEESGKIPKSIKDDDGNDWINNITHKEMAYYEQALEYLKNEYVKIVEQRYDAAKNVTVIHGDLHTGRIRLSKSPDKKAIIIEPQGFRIGLCTEDLAMLIALHISSDDSETIAVNFNDTQPMLDYYYQCLCEKVKNYSHETFMNDYKLSVAENLFFPIRLINDGIYDFRMRDKAIRAFEAFV